MIRRGELILDDQHAIVGEVAAQEIKAERSNRVLRHYQLEIDSQHVGEHVRVLEQPWREVVCLVYPYGAWVQPLDPTEVHCATDSSSLSICLTEEHYFERRDPGAPPPGHGLRSALRLRTSDEHEKRGQRVRDHGNVSSRLVPWEGGAQLVSGSAGVAECFRTSVDGHGSERPHDLSHVETCGSVQPLERGLVERVLTAAPGTGIRSCIQRNPRELLLAVTRNPCSRRLSLGASFRQSLVRTKRSCDGKWTSMTRTSTPPPVMSKHCASAETVSNSPMGYSSTVSGPARSMVSGPTFMGSSVASLPAAL